MTTSRYFLSRGLTAAVLLFAFAPSAYCQWNEYRKPPPLLFDLTAIPQVPKSYLDVHGSSWIDSGKIDQKRVETYKLLQASTDLIGAKKYPEALAKLQELDGMADKTAEETFTMERMRVSIASQSGDDALLVKSLEAVIALGKLPPEEQSTFMQVLANRYYQQKNYPKSITWSLRYLNEGGKDATVRTQVVYAYYANKDYAKAAQELRSSIASDEAAGHKPTEQQLRLLASCMLKLQDAPGYLATIEKFVVYYPKDEHWAELFNHVTTNPNFTNLLTLDIYRLMLATNLLKNEGEFIEMSQLAMQNGYPGEAKRILMQGYKSGVLGKGPDLAMHKNLLNSATDRLARKLKTIGSEEASFIKNKDGTGLVEIGYFYVAEGQFERGIGLIEKGIQLGARQSDHAKLLLGIANALAGHKDSAIQAFKTVQGTDGTADLARYWVLHLSSAA